MPSRLLSRRLPTVRALLLWLVLACLLPGVLGAAALLVDQYRQTRQQIEQTTVLTARALVQAVDNHLHTVQAVSLSLAHAQSLQSGDLARFHGLARQVMRQVGLDANVVLRDAAGRQLLNTAVDYGQPLSPPPAPQQVRAVFETGRPVVSDLFLGPVLGRLLVSVDVPVWVDGRIRYALGVGILAQQFDDVLRRQNLPSQWICSIVDRRGTIVARTHMADRYVGKSSSPDLLAQLRQRPEGRGKGLTLEGTGVNSFYSRSSSTGWSVAIGIPDRAADAVFAQTASRMAAGIAVLFALGTWVAWRIGGRISGAFQGLMTAAGQLGAGRTIAAPHGSIQEADEVTRALHRTSVLLQERADTLRASQARFRALADNIAQLAWMADREGCIQWFNQRWYEFTGATPGTPQDVCWQASQHPDHAQRVQDRLDRCLAAGEPWEDTFPLRRHDGQYRWFLSRAFALRDVRGDVVSWFGTHTDITVQLQAQQALLEADQRKDEFIALLAHELRNPLAPVRTAVEIVRRIDGLQPPQRRACEVIARQVSHMARLIDDLLDVSRIARGKMALQRQRCDLALIARQTAADYRDSLQALGLALVIEVGLQPLWVDGDPVRLAQMIANLLSNAQRFTDAGGQVTVRAQADEAAGRACVSVRDTGVGIAPEFLARLFDPFSQAHQDLARSKGGLGLGLALTRGLAQMHGGTVEAHSEGLGRGAVFTLALPLRARAPLPPPSADAAHARPGGLRILVIEDHEDAAQSLGDLLTLSGHQVRLAFDGESGLRAAQEERPDVVISDIGLPGRLDGYAVAARLRALPALAGVRLIALSGYADARARERARAAGFDAHIAKPADLNELEAALRPA